MNYCKYYQAKINRSLTWFFVATFRSYEHMGFDRTYDVQEGIFEFFIPEGMETDFLNLMHYFESQKIISDFKKLPNRFKEEDKL